MEPEDLSQANPSASLSISLSKHPNPKMWVMPTFFIQKKTRGQSLGLKNQQVQFAYGSECGVGNELSVQVGAVFMSLMA